MNIEIVKNYWDRRPCNIKHSVKPIGTLEYFDEVEKKKYFVEPHIPTFAEFNKWKGKKVLEIGCGIGTDSINFARAGAELTCVELSNKSLDLCKKRFQEYGLKARFVLCNAEELSDFIKNEQFDLIYSFGVIHHSPNPYEIMKKVKDLCHKDTRLKIMVYSLVSYKTLEAWIKCGYKFKFSFKKSIQYYAEAQLGCPVAYTYTKKDLKKLFKDYHILSIKKTHIFPYVIKKYIRGQYQKRWFFNILPLRVFSWLETVLGWHWIIELEPKNNDN